MRTWESLVAAVGDLDPQSVHYSNPPLRSTATIHLHTCEDFAAVCDRLKIPAKKRTTRSMQHVGYMEHSAEAGDLLVMHLHWRHSTCEPVQDALPEGVR